jgi:NAD-dependent SIR2 family protein deacetylase
MLKINDFDKVLVTAGAGMGVDSGLPDFRGDQGFWEAYPLLKEKDLSFVDMANPQAFEYYPYLAWGIYGHRLGYQRFLGAVSAEDNLLIIELGAGLSVPTIQM